MEGPDLARWKVLTIKGPEKKGTLDEEHIYRTSKVMKKGGLRSKY